MYVQLFPLSENPVSPRFPVGVLSDGDWHRMALSVSTGRLALYVDCSMVESVDWAYKDGLGISTDGLVMVGGIIEGFETPFEVRMQINL